MHIGSLIAAQGYFFPISDHVLTLKDDGTFYRFQVSRRQEGRDSYGIQALFMFLSSKGLTRSRRLNDAEFYT